jgi:predicted dehydrogenase
MVMSVGVIGIEGADPWLLDALLDPGQSDLVVAGWWSPPRTGTGGCNGARRNVQHVESLDELIAAADCLYIGTSVALRLPFACRAIAQHKPVFCEQPLTKDPAETAHFVREAQNARVTVNYVTPSVPAITHLRNWLQWGAIGAPYRLDLALDRIARVPVLPCPYNGAWQESTRSNDLTPDLLLHYLFLALRLLGTLRFQGPHSAAPYGLRHGAVAFQAGSIPTILSRCTSRQAPEAASAWTLHGVGAIRLCGWSTLERAAPGGSWWRETAPLSNHQVRTLAAARQVKELAALAGGRPHHLATHFEAYELEAFVSLLRWAGEGTGI